MRPQQNIAGKDKRIIFAAGAFTAVSQTLFVRETLAVVSGNELVIGILLAVWLSATALGSVLGGKLSFVRMNVILVFLTFFCFFGFTGIRAVRLFLMPGESPSLPVILCAVTVCEAPLDRAGGYVFGALAKKIGGSGIYRWEQAGSLAGLAVLSAAIAAFVPNFVIAAAVSLVILFAIDDMVGRIITAALTAIFVLSDHTSSAWKYPLRVQEITYTPEGEVARAVVDGKKITFVNGSLYSAGYSIPAVEQAVHTPLGMHPGVRKVLIINSAGHLEEARKYRGAEILCIRTDHLFNDAFCQYGTLKEAQKQGPFDVVVMGGSVPDNAASSRFFTHAFFTNIRRLTGDSGIFSFTMPFNTEYSDQRQQRMRDVIVYTLMSVYRYIRILPGEGFTFTASDIDYTFPEVCKVENNYYNNLILAGLTAERINEANKPPVFHSLHTPARPLLLAASLDWYIERLKAERWILIALPFFLVMLLMPSGRWSVEALSVGSSGLCAGVYSVAIILLYQSVYGTVYSRLSLLMLFLAAGFTAGCFVRKLPFSDLLIGGALGGSLLALSLCETPPAPFFFIGNAAAGFLTAGQFVTRRSTPPGVLYAADCMGGVPGMALASTLMIPVFGASVVAAGIIIIKTAVWFAVILLSRIQHNRNSI